MKQQKFRSIGIDGCRAGWLACLQNKNNTLIDCVLSPSLEELLWRYGAEIIFIDIPIGLPGEGYLLRECDSLARKLLRKRSSTIFSPPSRAALLCQDYQTACEQNYELTGRKISRQAWNLRSKIVETDNLLDNFNLKESHPELCFAGLTGVVCESSKHTVEGIQERLSALESYDSRVRQIFERAREKFNKSSVKDDDIVDALILAIAAGLTLSQPEGYQVLPAEPAVDDIGRQMALHFWEKRDLLKPC